MSESAAHHRRATWAEYERLPVDVRHEYIDGEIVVTPFPTPRHSLAISELQIILRRALPASLVSVSHTGWRAGADGSVPT